MCYGEKVDVTWRRETESCDVHQWGCCFKNALCVIPIRELKQEQHTYFLWRLGSFNSKQVCRFTENPFYRIKSVKLGHLLVNSELYTNNNSTV